MLLINVNDSEIIISLNLFLSPCDLNAEVERVADVKQMAPSKIIARTRRNNKERTSKVLTLLLNCAPPDLTRSPHDSCAITEDSEQLSTHSTTVLV